ncbi:hypothetical protein FJT64_018401 [Amphibalanus amphitrite]|uniref:Uncharacterized protein n=1 Tax=Amphibalanus amphitrite TaxID=1232801 RepID=A0A6A4WUV4_AMPAM|nr:hypothetical protein FJT64_018401 [Amphibalanus amphitrite]
MDIVASTGVRVKVMTGGDFVEAENVFSEAKIRLLQGIDARPYLRDLKVIQVRKGSDLLYTKSSFDQTSWRTYNLVKAKVDLARPLRPRGRERCINKEKIDDLCSKLVHLMPSHKRAFWLRLQQNAKATVRHLVG